MKTQQILNQIGNEESTFLACSYYEYQNGLCDQEVYDQKKKSSLYVDLYFERNRRKNNELLDSQAEFFELNKVFSFLPRTIYNDALKNQLFNILYIYNADNTSFMAGNPSINDDFSSYTPYEECMGEGYPEPFDPRCRGWYKQALSNKGFVFQEPYSDATNHQIIMTLSTEVRHDNGEFASILSVDFGIDNLINSFYSETKQDENEAYYQYNVLFHEYERKVFFHKDFDNKNGVLKGWEDIEFSTQYSYTEQEKQHFKQQVDDTLLFIKQSKYSVPDFQNIDPYFQTWSRNGEKFFSLVYPITINTQLNILPEDERKTSFDSVMLTAKVSKDYRDQLRLFNVFNDDALVIPFIIETVLLTLFILLFLAHYGILQMRQVYIPVILLIQFLQKTLKQQLLSTNNKKKSYFFESIGTEANTHQNKKQTPFLKSRISQQSKTTARTLLTDSPLKTHQKTKSITTTPAFLLESTQSKNFTRKNQTPKLSYQLQNSNNNIKQNFNRLNSQQDSQEKLTQRQLLTNQLIQTPSQKPNLKNGFIVNQIQQIHKNSDDILIEQTPIMNQLVLGTETNNNENTKTQSPFQLSQQGNQNQSSMSNINKLIDTNQQFQNNESNQQQERKNNLGIIDETEKMNKDTYTQNKNSGRGIISRTIAKNIERNKSKESLSQKNNVSFSREKVESINTSMRKSKQSISSMNTIQEELREDNIASIEPMFKEMTVIKDTFEQLENVINYAIRSNQSNQTITQSLFHFANAKSTFQKISNINGLQRCYFNLGTLSLILENYEQSIEEIYASILAYLQSNGLNTLDDFCNSLNKGCSNQSSDHIFLFSKKLFFLSYAYKRQALKNHENSFNFPIKLDHQQRLFVTKSLKYLEQVTKIIQVKPKLFQIVYKLMVILEFAELHLLNENLNLVEYYLSYFDQMIENQSQYSTFIIKTSESLKNKTQNKKNIRDAFMRKKRETLYSFQFYFQINSEDSDKIINAIIIKSFFITAQMQLLKGNIYEACDNFTYCIEEGKYYDPYIREASVNYLNQIFLAQNIPNLQIQQMIKQIDSHNSPYDFIFLLDESNLQFKQTQISIIQHLRDINYFKKEEDRFCFMSYGDYINNIQSMQKINEERTWSICFESFLQNQQSLDTQFNDSQRLTYTKQDIYDQQQVALSEAYLSAFLNINKLNQQPKCSQIPSTIQKDSINKQDQTVLSNNQNPQNNRRTIIMSFSFQEFESDSLTYNEIFTKQQQQFIEKNLSIKPDIYHLSLATNDSPEIENIFNENQEQNQNNESSAYPNFYIYKKENTFLQALFQSRNFQKNSKHSLLLSFISHDY